MLSRRSIPLRLYAETFYRDQVDVSRDAARVIVPMLVDTFRPDSVMDVGAGTGVWMAEFRRAGVSRVAGMDAGEVPEELLAVPRADISRIDLALPLPLRDRYDLVLCLEVAEHLPQRRAASFVQELTQLGSIVVFSAAIPGQGGTGHINEMWQSEWAKLFERCGYLAHDVVRSAVWDHPRVASYYAQNIIVYSASRSDDSRRPFTHLPSLDVVHPRLFRRKTQHPVLVAIADHLPHTVKNRLTSQLRHRLPFLGRP